MSNKALLLLTTVLLAAACGGAAQTASDQTPSASAPAHLTPSASASANLDPCQLITQQEASQLAGASFATGKEETNSGGGRMCVYGAQTTNVFTIGVFVATDAASAQAGWDENRTQAEANLQQEGVNMSFVPVTLAGADKAQTAFANETLGGKTLSISAIYVLKGRTFFTFSDLVLGAPAPSTARMETQALTVISRIP